MCVNKGGSTGSANNVARRQQKRVLFRASRTRISGVRHSSLDAPLTSVQIATSLM